MKLIFDANGKVIGNTIPESPLGTISKINIPPLIPVEQKIVTDPVVSARDLRKKAASEAAPSDNTAPNPVVQKRNQVQTETVKIKRNQANIGNKARKGENPTKNLSDEKVAAIIEANKEDNDVDLGIKIQQADNEEGRKQAIIKANQGPRHSISQGPTDQELYMRHGGVDGYARYKAAEAQRIQAAIEYENYKKAVEANQWLNVLPFVEALNHDNMRTMARRAGNREAAEQHRQQALKSGAVDAATTAATVATLGLINPAVSTAARIGTNVVNKVSRVAPKVGNVLEKTGQLVVKYPKTSLLIASGLAGGVDAVAQDSPEDQSTSQMLYDTLTKGTQAQDSKIGKFLAGVAGGVVGGGIGLATAKGVDRIITGRPYWGLPGATMKYRTAKTPFSFKGKAVPLRGDKENKGLVELYREQYETHYNKAATLQADLKATQQALRAAKDKKKFITDNNIEFEGDLTSADDAAVKEAINKFVKNKKKAVNNEIKAMNNLNKSVMEAIKSNPEARTLLKRNGTLKGGVFEQRIEGINRDIPPLLNLQYSKLPFALSNINMIGSTAYGTVKGAQVGTYIYDGPQPGTIQTSKATEQNEFNDSTITAIELSNQNIDILPETDYGYEEIDTLGNDSVYDIEFNTDELPDSIEGFAVDKSFIPYTRTR